MTPGDVVDVVKGPHKGQRAKIRGSSGWYYHVQLLTASGRKIKDGLVSLHRSAIREDER